MSRIPPQGDQSTREDDSDIVVVVKDHYSINSDSFQTPPATLTQSPSKLSFCGLCCWRKKNHSGRHRSIPQSVTDLFEQYIDQIEEEVRNYQSRAHAEQLYEKLKEKAKRIQSLMKQLQDIIDQEADITDKHRENPQKSMLTSSTSEALAIQLTEMDNEIRNLKEQCDKRTQHIKLLEDEKHGQCEQAKQFEIDYLVEAEENTLLRTENETLKHQLDSGLVVCLDDEGDDYTGEINDFKRVVSGLKVRVLDLNEDVNRLRDHSKEQSRQILKYKQQVEVSHMMEGQLGSMERMYHEVKEECNQKHEQLMSAKRIIKELEQQCQEQLQAKDELQSEVAALKAQLTVYKADFDQERQDRAEAHSRMADLERKGAHIEGQIVLEREEHHREYKDLKYNHQIMSSQLEQHQLALTAVEEANENLRQEIQAKSSQVKQYAKEVDRLKRELEENRSRVSEKTATHTQSDASGMKCFKLEDLYRTAQDDIQCLSDENSRHLDRIEMLERENVQLKNLLESQMISAAMQEDTPHRHKNTVDMNPPLEVVSAEEAHHKEPCAHPSVSPLTGEKHNQLAPQAGHLKADYVELDGPSLRSREALQSPKHPANPTFPSEQESVSPKQIRPDQQKNALAPNHQDRPSLPGQLLPQQQLHSQAKPIPKPTPQLASDPCEGGSSPNHTSEWITDREYHTKDQQNRRLEDSITQFENPLQKELDDEIHQQAAEVIQEVGRGRQEVKTDLQRPFDPNLVCPMCRRKFRIGEIQKFRRHVNTCTGTDDD